MPEQSQVEFIPRHVIDQENSYSRYKFPISKEGIQKVQSKAQLDQILRGMFYVQFQSKGINIPYPYQIQEKTRIKNIMSISKLGFKVRCRICTNYLTYSRDIDSPSSMFYLQSFYSQHDHRLNQKRKIGYQNQKVYLDYRTSKQKKVYLNLKKYGRSIDDIEKCISELPINLMQEMRQRVICRHFNISINQFKNIYLKLNSKKEIEFSEFVQDLHKKNYQYRYLPEDLLKENPKITRKYHQPAAFSVNPNNHQRKDDKQAFGGTNVPEIDVDAKKNSNNNKSFLVDVKNGNFQQPKTKGLSFPLIDPNTNQIPKSNPINPNNSSNSSLPKGLNGNDPSVPLYKINPNIVDPNNPNLPNVLLIISPSMKQMYRKYGQYMGFDLTFSLIRQQPTHTEKQYLVGVFASKNESFRIVIFGLVVTNNQSAMVYKWLFKNFMQIMGKQPQTIITDEQVAIGKALKQLKTEGFYHGHHLLDTFHVLTKFRKAVESETFQYLRKLIHAKDKYEYKTIFEQCMNQLTSDDEIKVLQDFDYHCQKYCYAHIPPTFVGFGVSDAMNESFHNILKDKIPYEIKYLKAVNIMLPFLQQRNQIGTLSLICQIPYQQQFKFPFLKPYRKIVSDRLFYYLIHECSKGITHSIVFDDSKYDTNECQKIQDESESMNRKEKQKKYTELRNNLQKSKFQIVTKQGVCLVWKEKIPQLMGLENESQITCDPSTGYWSHYPQKSTYTTNIYPYSQFEPKLLQNQYKWRCICQMEEKAGLCCSHILKILILKNESLLPYIHPRWFVREENIFQGLKSMMKLDSSLKFVANITTDLSNSNRLKSVRLRDKYISARNNIKKELEEIVDDKIPSLQSEATTNLQCKQKRLQLGMPTQKQLNPQIREKSKNPIQQEYMEWVSANDENIKMQKQKYYKILERKRKMELKRLRKQQKLGKKKSSRFDLDGEELEGGEKNVKGQKKYVDYVYLKPYQMRGLQGGDGNKNRKRRGRRRNVDEAIGPQQEENTQQQQEVEYEPNSETASKHNNNNNWDDQNSGVSGQQQQSVGPQQSSSVINSDQQQQQQQGELQCVENMIVGEKDILENRIGNQDQQWKLSKGMYDVGEIQQQRQSSEVSQRGNKYGKISLTQNPHNTNQPDDDDFDNYFTQKQQSQQFNKQFVNNRHNKTSTKNKISQSLQNVQMNRWEGDFQIKSENNDNGCGQFEVEFQNQYLQQQQHHNRMEDNIHANSSSNLNQQLNKRKQIIINSHQNSQNNQKQYQYHYLASQQKQHSNKTNNYIINTDQNEKNDDDEYEEEQILEEDFQLQGGANGVCQVQQVKRQNLTKKRGRPRKNHLVETKRNINTVQIQQILKNNKSNPRQSGPKKRGRPKKNPYIQHEQQINRLQSFSQMLQQKNGIFYFD